MYNIYYKLLEVGCKKHEKSASAASGVACVNKSRRPFRLEENSLCSSVYRSTRDTVFNVFSVRERNPFTIIIIIIATQAVLSFYNVG